MLEELLHQYREMKGYSQTSRWYLGLSQAISFLKRAETDEDPIERFRDVWSSVNNLLAQHGGPGDDEYRILNRWVSSLSEVPRINHLFQDHGSGIDFSDFLNRIRVIR